jgi:hypothetical protein
MNYIVSKCRYIVYPAEGPRPLDPEELGEKLAIKKALRLKQEKKEAEQKEAARLAALPAPRKKWFGVL